MLLTITLKITVITSGHHKDILTLSPKCLKPVSVFTLSSIRAEHKKLLVLKKSFQSCCSHSSFATSSKIKVTMLNLWPYNHFQFTTTNYNAQNTEIRLYGQSFYKENSYSNTNICNNGRRKQKIMGKINCFFCINIIFSRSCQYKSPFFKSQK